MRVTRSALSLNVEDVRSCADWAIRHLGFSEEMSADGFTSLAHPDAGFNLIYLRVGLESFRPSSVAGHADGLLVVLTVEDVDAEHERLLREGATVVTPPETEPWGERYLQLADPDGVVFQLVQWVDPPDPQYAG